MQRYLVKIPEASLQSPAVVVVEAEDPEDAVSRVRDGEGEYWEGQYQYWPDPSSWLVYEEGGRRVL